MLGGYAGQLLRVNLTTGDWETEPLPDESELRKYVGGIGLAMRIILDETHAGMKATDPDSPFLMMNGPLAGTSVAAGLMLGLVSLQSVAGSSVVASPASSQSMSTDSTVPPEDER